MADNLDYRSELDDWIDMWSAAEESGVHPEPEPIKSYPDTEIQKPEGSDHRDMFYDFIQDSQMADEIVQDMHDDTLIQEDQRVPNPVYPDSVGPDHTTTPPVWVNEERLMKEIESLKGKLFELENQIAQLGGGKNWQEKVLVRKTPTDISKKMEDLRAKMERTSNKLGIEDEPSPWVVKGD